MSSTEENKAIVLRWFAEVDRGNLDIIDELIAEDYLDHNPALPKPLPGREGVREYITLLRTAFPDAVHTIDDVIAEGDRVMTRISARGTFLGECIGYQPNGNTIEINGFSVHRLAGGKLVEHWAQVDMAGFMQQIGAPSGGDERS